MRARDLPYFAGCRPPLNIAHRGGSALAPENTLEAFIQAVEKHHADVLELDLHLSRDGVPVVSHDPTVDRCTDGNGALAQLDFADLSKLDAGFHFTPDGTGHPFRGKGVRIPSFEQVLTHPALVSTRLNVELKVDSPGFEELFADLVRKHGAAERICCGSQLDAVAEKVRRALPEACLFFPEGALTEFVMAVHQGNPPPESPWHVLEMPYALGDLELVTPDLVRWAAVRGKWLEVWTVNEPERMKHLMELGVGGLITDRPDLLAELLADRRAGKPC